MKVMKGLVMTLEEDEIFMYLAALLCNQFCRFANEGAKISIKSYFMRSFFFSVYSAAVECSIFLLFGVNCLLQLAGLGKKKRGNCEANLLYVESDFCNRHHRQIIHSVLRSLRR